MRMIFSTVLAGVVIFVLTLVSPAPASAEPKNLLKSTCAVHPNVDIWGKPCPICERKFREEQAKRRAAEAARKQKEQEEAAEAERLAKFDEAIRKSRADIEASIARREAERQRQRAEWEQRLREERARSAASRQKQETEDRARKANESAAQAAAAAQFQRMQNEWDADSARAKREHEESMRRQNDLWRELYNNDDDRQVDDVRKQMRRLKEDFERLQTIGQATETAHEAHKDLNPRAISRPGPIGRAAQGAAGIPESPSAADIAIKNVETMAPPITEFGTGLVKRVETEVQKYFRKIDSMLGPGDTASAAPGTSEPAGRDGPNRDASPATPGWIDRFLYDPKGPPPNAEGLGGLRGVLRTLDGADQRKPEDLLK